MRVRKFFIIKAALISLLAFGVVFYIIPLVNTSEFFTLRAIFFALIIFGLALVWAIALFYRVLGRMTENTLGNLDKIERLLLDIRDGTKYFYREKRRSFRIKTDILARFADKAAGDDFVKIYALSYEGAHLKTTRLLKAGDSVKLSIYLPFFSQPIFATAKTMRVRPTKETKGVLPIYEAGLEYTDMPEQDSEKLIETINILSRMPRRKLSP